MVEFNHGLASMRLWNATALALLVAVVAVKLVLSVFADHFQDFGLAG